MNRFGWLLSLLFFQLMAIAQQAPDAPSEAQSPIGYETVQDAFDALSADSAATKSEYEGWTLFRQKGDGKYILWSFTPDDHQVHPSAVRRDVVKKNGEVFITMAVLCYSSRFDCDQLIEQFQHINEGIRERLASEANS
ncbi:MAG: molecular chaperone DnaJ [Gammaproteobacteria bacterium]|nr:molecular chaperone DnaJ [Gammaproteobacteria bacterium]